MSDNKSELPPLGQNGRSVLPSSRSNALCDHYMDDGPVEGWGGTFCKLRTGHRGPHSPHYPVSRPVRRCAVCGAVEPGHPEDACPLGPGRFGAEGNDV